MRPSELPLELKLSPKFRGEGIGKREAEALARAAHFFTAFCSEGNGGASILFLS